MTSPDSHGISKLKMLTAANNAHREVNKVGFHSLETCHMLQSTFKGEIKILPVNQVSNYAKSLWYTSAQPAHWDQLALW